MIIGRVRRCYMYLLAVLNCLGHNNAIFFIMIISNNVYLHSRISIITNNYFSNTQPRVIYYLGL